MDVQYQPQIVYGLDTSSNNARSLQGNLARSTVNQRARTIVAIQKLEIKYGRTANQTVFIKGLQ